MELSPDERIELHDDLLVSAFEELRLFANPSFDRYVPQGTRTIHVVLRMAVVRASADGYIDGMPTLSR